MNSDSKYKMPIELTFSKRTCISILIPLSFASVGGQTNIKPNVVFILADDLGWKDLGCYGNNFNETPYIDSLANTGILFTQAYSSSPVSSPSRASILTGKHSAKLKLTNYLIGNKTVEDSPVLPAKWQPFLDTKETTLAEMLKTAGYTSGMVGKWHLGSDDSQTPWGQGFDYSRVIGKNGLDYYNYSIFIDSYEKEFKDNGTEYLTDKLTQYGVDFIEQNKQHPFFLYLAYSAPHIMLVPKAGMESKYLKKYDKVKNVGNNPYYAAMIESMDDGVGQIIKTLRENGLLENTIVVFTSDNGGVIVDEMGPIPTSVLPLKGGKGSLYEGGVRIPAIVSWPTKISKKEISDYYFSNIDYVPTICQLTGVEAPKKTIDGKSIQDILLNPEHLTNQNDTLYWHYPHFSNQGGRPSSAIRIGDYKLIEFYESNKVELYDIKNDIGEKKDLSNSLKEKTSQLYSALKNWKKRVDAELPIPNPNYRKIKNSKHTNNSKNNDEQD
ncbi:MAG: sulfatase [Bacteroidales bacterium]|nr:sulfatase [Bacteroidales bacterium]